MICVVVDTNVYVSAFLFGGLPERVFLFAEEGAFTICISPAIAQEIRSVLTRKFGWSKSELAELLDPFLVSLRTVIPSQQVNLAKDRADNEILACALEAEAEAIVTGDDHLLKLKAFQGIPIMTPRQFITIKPWRW